MVKGGSDVKVSVSMYSLSSTIKEEKWSILDFCHFAHSIGLESVELLDFYWTDEQKERPEVMKCLDELGMTVCCYDVSNDFVKQTQQERDVQIRKVKKAIDTAVALKTNVVRVFCGDVKDGISFEDGKSWIIEGLAESAVYAEQQGVILAIENHGLLAGKSDQVKEILTAVQSPNVKSTFDTGNFLLVEDDPLKGLQKLIDQVGHVHFKDFRKKQPGEQNKGFTSITGQEWIGVVPGDGEVDVKGIIQELKKSGYDGWLSVEYEGFDDAKSSVKEAVSRLHHYVNEQEVKG